MPSDTDETVYQKNSPGGILVILGLITAFAAYPLPTTRFEPLFGFGDILLPLSVAVVSLVFAAVGGVLLAYNFRSAQKSRVTVLAARIFIPLGCITIVSVYYTVASRVEPQTPFIIGSVVMSFTDVLINR
jgi:predicted membrane channel-forming protein YqfA (hemolysin III family)